jgi:flagellin
MAAVINTNMASLQAQNQLSRTTASLNNTIQQLSSGLRVNSAADDASGYAISKNMDSIINGSTVAIRNANDGISFSQTATGALDSLSNILSRMRELSTQAANEANGVTNVDLLQTEFKANQDELVRIIANTKFNNVSVFSDGDRSFQIGSGTSDNDSITLTTSALLEVTNSAASTSVINGNSGAAPGIAIVRAAEAAAGATYSGTTAEQLAAAKAALITAVQSAIHASTLTDANKEAADVLATAAADTIVVGDSIEEALTIMKDAIGSVTEAGVYVVGNTASLAVASSDAATNAQLATDLIDDAIDAVNTEAATHGAFQNRMTFITANLSNLIQTTSAAKSRIVDTDFAAQTAQLSKYQILQQAGTAMLAQANQMGSNVLTLLK